MCNAKNQANQAELTQPNNSIFHTNKNVVTNKEFNENNTSNFMLSVWFYIDNWGNNISEEKNIIFVSSKAEAQTHDQLKNNLIGMSSSVEISNNVTYKNLSIGLDNYENNLFIDIETYSEKTTTVSNNDNKTTLTRYLIKNIPVQKWNCITLSVDTKVLDVYLDGKLRNSFILHGIYRNYFSNNEKKNIYIGHIHNNSPGFEGFITRIRYQPNSINPEEAYSIYKKGISASLAKSIYNKYGLKVSFLEYDKERGSFTI